jgi:hypothetical protein
MSLGVANANGIGLFRDRGGNDRYAADGDLAFGAAGNEGANALRAELLTLGIFVDSGRDEDRYVGAKPPARNSALWMQPALRPDAERKERGAGIDE